MNEATFLGLMIGGLITLLGFMTAIITPIVKLNTTITKLNETIKHLTNDAGVQKDRITEHGKEIDALNNKVINHEDRIKCLEKDKK